MDNDAQTQAEDTMKAEVERVYYEKQEWKDYEQEQHSE